MNKRIAALVLVSTLCVGNAGAAETGEAAPPSGVTLTWLGNAGWQVSNANTVILVDPYLSRLRAPAPPGAPPLPAGETRPAYNWEDRPESDRTTIDAHIRRADLVLVTHAHGSRMTWSSMGTRGRWNTFRRADRCGGQRFVREDWCCSPLADIRPTLATSPLRS
jgi:hypothetical protein